MTRSKTTVYVDSEVLRAARVWAARTGRKDSELFETALRSYLGLELLENIWEKSQLTEEEALDLAYGEIHAARS